DTLRTKISFTELTRDDRAHRFVVSWNAFQDGNRLAYLALAIAIGIDSLIFMTGLFGANAIRSPLSDVPSLKTRTAKQLEAIVENALLPDVFENARAMLDAMQAITPEDGYVAEIWLSREGLDSHIAAVLNAGATIGAVKRDDAWPDRYVIRAELFEFLSIVARKAFASDKEKVRLADLEKAIKVALAPDVARNAQIVQDALMPITEEEGFSAEMHLAADISESNRVLRKVLNAGSTFGVIQRAGTDPHFFIHGDLVRVLNTIQARAAVQTSRLPALETPRGRQVRDAGELRPAMPSLSSPAGERPPQKPAVSARPLPTLPAPVKKKWLPWRSKPKDPTPLPAAAKRGTPKEVAGGEGPHKRLRVPDRSSDPDARLRNAFRSELLRIMRIDSLAYAQIRTPELQPAVAAATDVLAKFTRSSKFPSTWIRKSQQKLHDALNGAYSGLWGQHEDKSPERRILEQVHGEIADGLPALMLAADGPYERMLGEIVQGIERETSAEGFTPEEKAVLDSLRHQQATLHGIDRSRPDGWDRIAKILMDGYAVSFNPPKARRGS
ncbi:MAG: hypothetical protein ACREC6_11395, partial [Hyphomicrobiaceae bacterium]